VIDTVYTYKELFGQQEEVSSYGALSIKVASPEVVRSWSHGEIKNAETINYRSFKPEKGGLFCERIFGPVRDWECNCGKYKRIKHKGVVCDRCGVEVTMSRVRRERMGHIELAVPVSHIWFFKCMPSRIGLMLDMTARALERVIYYEDWVVTDPGDTQLTLGQPLTEMEYRQAREDYGKSFEADIGAPGIRTLLEKINLEELKKYLEREMASTKSRIIRVKIAKRLRLVDGFITGKSRPEWMILTILPVLPPDLRPLVPLEGGKFATSDLNDLYRRIINRNNRLRNLLKLRTPDVIIRNEKRMLQESVDALLDNGRHGRAVTGAGNRPLKSLSEMLKGKQGRFRQNLLGKRVDYSGRSVIVVGPELELGQCGLPKKMALSLFEPFIIRHLRERGKSHTVRSAKKMIEQGDPLVWDILEEVIKGHPVMLNRAPTLHRLSIQAFDPILIEGSAIRIHPLVCTAFNADFDGDQMAVHIPLSYASQMEAKMLMFATNNIFSPSNNKPITTPTQDIILGIYYLTAKPYKNEKTTAFKDYFEAIRSLEAGKTTIHELIIIPNPDYGRDTAWGNKEQKIIETSVGRCIFNEIWSSTLGFYNDVVKKKNLGELISRCYEYCGNDMTIKVLDALKTLGYEYATKAAFSISISDIFIPEDKKNLIEKAKKEIEEIEKQAKKGVITAGEKHNKVIDIWTQTSNKMATGVFSALDMKLDNKEEINPLYAMLDSGARGSKDQIRQLAGMRGLMAKPSGDIIERPIISNFREGLTVLEYFISTHGARKGLADTALKTADAGYLTRRLVDAAQDVICKEEDCGTIKGIKVKNVVEGDEEIIALKDRILGRFSAQNIHDPLSDKEDFIVTANQEITEDVIKKLIDRGINEIIIRSVLTCETKNGVCIKCYGKNLATNRLAEIGDPLGIIAAQSIGEPGTQLTMRTFHIGGTASSIYRQPIINARNQGTIRLEGVRTVINEKGSLIVVNRNGCALVEDNNGRMLDRFELAIGAVLEKPDGAKVKPKEKIASWDPYNVPIIAEGNGVVEFRDLIDGITMKSEKKGKEIREIIVMEHREDLHPQILIKDDSNQIISHNSLPAGAYIMINEGDKATVGTTLARMPRQTAKNKDIIGGLPRVAELFEARHPKDVAEIARIDGKVELGKMTRGRRELIVRDVENNQTEEHLISATKHITVGNGDYVKKGQKLTEGAVDPKELLEICGPLELQEYLVNEVQLVYRAQGVEINDKHIEVIARQMLRKVKVSDPGDTMFLPSEQVDRNVFLEENKNMESKGGKPAGAEPVLLGITRASIETDSWISAASFQDTTRVLTDAATLGKIDELKGFKENVIIGHLIPAGTGAEEILNLKIKKTGREISSEEFPTETKEESARTEEQTKAIKIAREILSI
jgi:DNA-directed RNA polymerase subunit beta'